MRGTTGCGRSRCRNYNDNLTGKVPVRSDRRDPQVVKGKRSLSSSTSPANPSAFRSTPPLPYRTIPAPSIATAHLLARAGARHMHILESFFPPAGYGVWARYGLDVAAINNLGTKIEWENAQNLGNGADYVRLKVPWSSYISRLWPQPLLRRLRRLRLSFQDQEPLDRRRHHGAQEQLRRHTLLSSMAAIAGPAAMRMPTLERSPVLRVEWNLRAAERHRCGTGSQTSPHDPGYRVPAHRRRSGPNAPHRSRNRRRRRNHSRR